jgi:hypothetical protein
MLSALIRRGLERGRGIVWSTTRFVAEVSDAS